MENGEQARSANEKGRQTGYYRTGNGSFRRGRSERPVWDRDNFSHHDPRSEAPRLNSPRTDGDGPSFDFRRGNGHQAQPPCTVAAAHLPARHWPEQQLRERRRPSRLAGAVWLATGLGLLAAGFADALAPQRPAIGQVLFWTAAFFPFVVDMTVLVAARPSRSLRLVIVSFVGVYPSIVYRMSSPLVLGGFDEHLHERTLLDLLHGSGLFAPNPLLSVSPYYPGLELFTGAMTRLTGMPVLLAMSLVVFLCRLLLVLIIYYAAITVLRSERGAAIVILLYASSPQFYFFNSQFAYQTMALTLGLGGIFLLRRAQFKEGPAARRLSRMAMLVLVATAVTHHVTSWLVLGFLLVWTVASAPQRRKIVMQAAIVMGVVVAAWTTAIANLIDGYLAPVFAAALEDLEGTAAGASQGQVFNVTGGYVTPEWQKLILLFYALCCTCAAIFCGGLLVVRGVRNRDRSLGLLGLLTLVYPATLAAHYVPAAADLGDRASTFLFLPFALSCALVIRDIKLPYWMGEHRLRGPVLFPLIILTSTVYIGGVVLGAGPAWEILPGPYLVSAESRTQDPETLAAVRWAASHIPEGSRIVADRVPADLFASQARLWPIDQPENGLEPALLYFSSTWGSYQTAIIKRLDIRYIYVDQRIEDSLPLDGFYFYQGETPTPERITSADLSKFAHVRGLKVVYHLGPVTIYDTAGLGVPQVLDGFTGVRSMGFGTAGDFILGVLSVGLIFALRRRLRWVTAVGRDAGILGSTVILMSATIMLAGALFEVLLMPGPAFSVGAIVSAIACFVIRRRWAGVLVLLRMLLPRRVDLLVVLGILAAVAGLTVCLHAAWNTDVTQVNRILQSLATQGKA